jgi:hypothetical protein
MLICVKDWEQGQEKAQHTAEDKQLEDYFKNLSLDGEGSSGAGAD